MARRLPPLPPDARGTARPRSRAAAGRRPPGPDRGPGRRTVGVDQLVWPACQPRRRSRSSRRAAAELSTALRGRRAGSSPPTVSAARSTPRRISAQDIHREDLSRFRKASSSRAPQRLTWPGSTSPVTAPRPQQSRGDYPATVRLAPRRLHQDTTGPVRATASWIRGVHHQRHRQQFSGAKSWSRSGRRTGGAGQQPPASHVQRPALGHHSDLLADHDPPAARRRRPARAPETQAPGTKGGGATRSRNTLIHEVEHQRRRRRRSPRPGPGAPAPGLPRPATALGRRTRRPDRRA